MKKTTLLFFCFVLTLHTGFSQKIYSTKSGQIKFFSSTPAEDIEAVNNEVDSKLTPAGQMMFTVLIKGFRFPNSLMQEHFNDDYMESGKFPRAEFKGVVTNMNTVKLNTDGVYKVTAEGTLLLHGVSKKISIPGTIEVKKGIVTAKSVFKLQLKDYNISGSEIGKAVAKDIEVTVNCKYN